MAVATKCEHCHARPVWRHNETVRDKATGKAKIMDICQPCFEKITGAGQSKARKMQPTYTCSYCPYGTFEPIAIHEHLKSHGIDYSKE